MPRFKLTLDLGFSGCEHEDEIEIPESELEGMNVTERVAYAAKISFSEMVDNAGVELMAEEIKEDV